MREKTDPESSECDKRTHSKYCIACLKVYIMHLGFAATFATGENTKAGYVLRVGWGNFIRETPLPFITVNSQVIPRHSLLDL